MNLKEDFLLHLKTHPYYPIFRKELFRSRPILPGHDPESDNTESWKSLSAQQKGFDLCCSFFNITEE